MHKELGQNWILLRGLARESEHWGDFVSLLQSTFPDAKITTLDLPGTGKFYLETSPGTIKAITNKLRSHALDYGCIQQPATFLALSLGAMVVWEWMRSYPADICGATLMNTSFAGISPFYQRLYWRSYKDILVIGMKRKPYNRELGILKLVSNRCGDKTHIIQGWEEIRSKHPMSLKSIFFQIAAAATYRPGDDKPLQPVLLLNGQGDRLVGPSCSKAIHNKWGLELRNHPWAGHDLTLDDGAWVAFQLKDWIAKNNKI